MIVPQESFYPIEETEQARLQSQTDRKQVQVKRGSCVTKAKKPGRKNWATIQAIPTAISVEVVMVVDKNGNHILRMRTVWLNDPVILMMISVNV